MSDKGAFSAGQDEHTHSHTQREREGDAYTYLLRIVYLLYVFLTKNTPTLLACLVYPAVAEVPELTNLPNYQMLYI